MKTTIFINIKAKNLKGKHFGKWTVLERAKSPNKNSPSQPAYWKCQCECGNIRIIAAHNLWAKKTLSCGHEQELPGYKHIYNTFLRINKNRFPVYLTFEEFLEFVSIQKCHYCYSKLNWSAHGGRKISKAYNLDRKDNTKGYSKDNCVPCCKRCNFSKRNCYTYEEWFEMNKCFRDKHSLE
jgi:hypothetical protein